MNEYDSLRIEDLLLDGQQFESVSDPELADVLLLNTCSIREKAQEKVFHQLGRWRVIKNRKPNLLIGVGGCVASQEGDAIIKRAPYVDIVFGPQTIHRLPSMLRKRKQALRKLSVVDITFPMIEKFDCLPEATARGATAAVSIMEGCSKYCSFCVVPYTRGEEVSRPLRSVLQEVARLAEQGVREINFLGQNVNAYEGELPATEAKADLAELIAYAAEIEGIDRIRFTTSHPINLSAELVDAYATIPQLVSHLHLPVQSGSDRILKLMKRGYTVDLYYDLIDRLRLARPNLSLSSDFIIGFPSETQEDFQATMDLVERIGFDKSFSFVYSARPGTPAASIPDSTPQEVKLERLKLLQNLLQAQTDAISQSMDGTQQNVLVTGKSKQSDVHLQGRTENNRVVNFASEDESLVGQFVTTRITEALPNSLRGVLIDY